MLRFVACDRPVSGNNRLVFFEDFSDIPYSFLLPSTKSPLIIAISFAIREQSGVIHAGQDRRVLFIVICINSAPTQVIDGTEKPIRSLQTRSAIQSSYQKRYLLKFSYPKNPKIENFKPQKIPPRSSRSLEIWSTPPPPPFPRRGTQATKSSKIY